MSAKEDKPFITKDIIEDFCYIIRKSTKVSAGLLNSEIKKKIFVCRKKIFIAQIQERWLCFVHDGQKRFTVYNTGADTSSLLLDQDHELANLLKNILPSLAFYCKTLENLQCSIQDSGVVALALATTFALEKNHKLLKNDVGVMEKHIKRILKEEKLKEFPSISALSRLICCFRKSSNKLQKSDLAEKIDEKKNQKNKMTEEAKSQKLKETSKENEIKNKARLRMMYLYDRARKFNFQRQRLVESLESEPFNEDSLIILRMLNLRMESDITSIMKLISEFNLQSGADKCSSSEDQTNNKQRQLIVTEIQKVMDYKERLLKVAATTKSERFKELLLKENKRLEEKIDILYMKFEKLGKKANFSNRRSGSRNCRNGLRVWKIITGLTTALAIVVTGLLFTV